MAESGDSSAERRAASEGVERELSVLFGRARSVSLALVGQVHPGLDAASYTLLLHLIDTGPVRAADLVERTGLDKSTVSRQIGRLEELELVERVADPSDGRARLVQLTANGQHKLDTVRTDRRQQLRAMFDSWSTEDMHAFSALLGRFNSSL